MLSVTHEVDMGERKNRAGFAFPKAADHDSAARILQEYSSDLAPEDTAILQLIVSSFTSDKDVLAQELLTARQIFRTKPPRSTLASTSK